MDPRALRQARQLVEIDALMGMDDVYAPAPEADFAGPAAAVDASDRASPVGLPPPRPAPAAASPPRFAPQRPAAAGSRGPIPTTYFQTLPTAPIERRQMSPEDKAKRLKELEADHAANCPHCAPQVGPLRLVFADGDPNAQLMFVGEGPGEEEDRQGLPFVGRAGQLLNKQIEAMGLKREQVYIANTVKVRPPGNRVPTPDEALKCMPWLHKQVEIVQPRVIVALGATAAKYLLNDPKLAITRARGTWFEFRGVPLMPTFHPAYLLRQYTVDNRRRVWEDLQKVLEKLGLPVPGKA